MLVHVLDSSLPLARAVETIDGELAAYGAGLDKLAQIVVLNKIDLVPEPPVFPVEDERVIAVFAALVRDRRRDRRLPAPPVHARARARARRGRRRARPARLPRLPARAEGTVVAALPHRPRLPARRHAAARRRARARAARRRREGRAPTSSRRRGRAFDAGALSAARSTRRTAGTSSSPGARRTSSGSTVCSCSWSRRPGTRRSRRPRSTRLRLARAAFPDDEVVLDEHARTIETLRAHPEWDDPVFLIGADQFCDFLVLAWSPTRCSSGRASRVATRPGFPRERLDAGARAAAAPRARAVLRDRAHSGRLERAARAARRRRRRVRRRAVRGRRASSGRTGCMQPARYTENRLTPIEQARRIAALAQDKLARSVVILDMRPVCTYTDYFVIATGANARQTKGIWDEVHAPPEEGGALLPRSVAGEREATWIIADYLDVVLHVFTPEARRVLPARGVCGTTSRRRRSKPPRRSAAAGATLGLARAHSSAGRASRWQREGRRFEPGWVHRSLLSLALVFVVAAEPELPGGSFVAPPGLRAHRGGAERVVPDVRPVKP